MNSLEFFVHLADKTNNRLGVNEMLMASSVNGFLFGFVSGQPLMILGPTGPFLVFEEMVYDVNIFSCTARLTMNCVCERKLFECISIQVLSTSFGDQIYLRIMKYLFVSFF